MKYIRAERQKTEKKKDILLGLMLHMILKLENRNKILLELLKSNNLENKHTGELDISIKNNYIRHHWTGFKG